MRRKIEIRMNQNCAEIMLMKAAQLVMGKKIQFRYKKDISDIQIDISPAFMFSPNEEKQIWYSGNKKELLEADLNQLNINKVYFLRTGTNNGAGHWQILYFNTTQNGWINYSTETNNYQLTEGNYLTESGKSLLSPFASWGASNGQYAFLLVEASQQNIVYAANYLYDIRMCGQTIADENAYAPKENFYPQIRNEANRSASTPSVRARRNHHALHKNEARGIERNSLLQSHEEPKPSPAAYSFLLNALTATAIVGGISLCVAALVTAILIASVPLSVSLLAGGLVLGAAGAGTFFYRYYIQSTTEQLYDNKLDNTDLQASYC